MRKTKQPPAEPNDADAGAVVLTPLLLSAEFDAQEQEPDRGPSTGGVGVDLLNLKADPQLSRFFEACEGQNPAVHELLLMSCSGFRRDVDARLLAEARRPVVQAPEQTSKVDAATKEATDAAATAAADRRKGDNSDAASAAAASATSPSTSARLSDWLRSKMNKKDGGAAAAAAAASDDREPTSAASASPSPPSASSRSSPSIGNARSGPLQRHAPPARRHSQSLLPDNDPPPMSYSGSGSASAAASAAKSNGRTAPRAAASLSSLSSASAALAADAERRLRLDRAPTAAPPSPCTLLLTNVALYLLPPSVPVEIEEAGHKRVKHFLVYNDFERIPLPDLSLVSLPYRSGLTRHGTDFALRITDFCLHLRAGESSVWLQAPRNGRSMVVESLSDAFENLTGRPLEMQQVDYAELIADVLSSASTAQQPTSPGMPAVGRIPEAVHEATSAWWASRRFVRQGYLFHRSMHVYPAMATEAAESSSATAAAASSSSLSPAIELRSAPATEWVHSFVALTSDGKLMEFRSSQEFSSFAYVASAAHQGKTTGKFPSRSNCNAIDLRRASLFLRAAAANVAPDGFELVVYPRSSSMAAQPAEASASDASAGSALHSRRTLSVSSKDGIHGSAISAAAAAGGALPNQQASLEYGYTRHLFQVPLPPIPPSQLAAAAAAAAAAQGQQGLSANQRRMQQQGSSADAVAAASPPSKEHLKRLSVVEADLQAWMRALTFAMTGVAPPAVALTPLTNPGSSPARSAAATDSPAASVDTAEEEFDGPKPRYSLGAVSSPKASPSQRQPPQRRHEQTSAAASSIPSSSSSSSSLLAPPAFPAYSPSSGSAASADDECLSAIPISPSPEASPPLLAESPPPAESPELSPVPVREPTPEPAIAHDADAASAGEAVAESATAAVTDSAASTAPTDSSSATDGFAAVSSSSSSSSALSPDEFSATIVPPLFDTDPQSSPHGAASPLHADPVPPLP